MWLSPELEFISNVLNLSLKPDHAHSEGKISPVKNINWDRFIPLVNHHRVGGLLFYWIRNLKLGNTVPPHVYKKLKDIYESYSNVWENHGQVLKKILVGCHEREMDVILLKGAQLAQSNYPERPLRPIEDIDLLVRQSDRSKVIKFMLEMGFNLYETNQTCDKFFIRTISERGREKRDKPIFIEVHSNLQTPIRLDRSFSIDVQDCWNLGQEKTVAGLPVLQLCPMDNLIYLCAHLSHHHFSRLIWIYDVALHIQQCKGEIDWEKLEDMGATMRIKGLLYHSMSLCREFFQIPTSEETLQDFAPSWWRREMVHFLIGKNLCFPERYRIGHFSQSLIKPLLIDNWMDAIMWFLFPTKEWLKKQYSLRSNHEVYPYYCLHPILYLTKAIRNAKK